MRIRSSSYPAADQIAHRLELGEPLIAESDYSIHCALAKDGLLSYDDSMENTYIYLIAARVLPFCEIAAFVLAALAEQIPTPAMPSRRTYRSLENGQPAAAFSDPASRCLHAIEYFAAIDFDHVIAALDAERFQRIGRQHAHLRVRGDAIRSHGVGVELDELAEAARSRLFVADTIAVA